MMALYNNLRQKMNKMCRAIPNFLKRQGLVIAAIIWVFSSISVPLVIFLNLETQPEWEWFRALGFYAAGVVLAPIGLCLAARRTRAIQKQAEADTRRTETDAKRQFSEAFSRAVELLGHRNAAVKQGAIHALAGLARKNPEQHQTIFNIITSYIRERSPNPPAKDTSEKLPVDIEAAMLEIINRDTEKDEGEGYDLSNAYLRGIIAGDIEATMQEITNLDIDTDFQRFKFNNANLSMAVLLKADLWKAFLPDADLSGANLIGANLTEANLTEAKLIGAKLIGADLTGAELWKANLSEANLSEAILLEANLHEANLSDAKNLTQEQIDQAQGDKKTILPDGITRPDKWIKHPSSN